MLRALIRGSAFALCRLFYPRVEMVGRERLPAGGALLFVSNHPNGLLDGLVIMRALGRTIAFLAKSTFFASPPLRLALEAFGAVPVYRRRDVGRAGGPRSGAGLADDNAAMFARAHALLAGGGELALFPEGTPNPGPALLPLRSGAARIALGAEEAAGWRLGLRVVPVALWYEEQTRFRSAAVVAVGEPLEVRRGESAGELTGRIGAALAAIVPQAASAEELGDARALAALVAPDPAGRYAALLGLLRGGRSLAAGARATRSHLRRLRRCGLADAWALEGGASPGRLAGLALAAGLPVAAVGAALSVAPLRLLGWAAPLLTRGHSLRIGTSWLVAGAALLCGWWAAAGAFAAYAAGLPWGAALALAAPALSYAALRWAEGWRALREAAAARRLRRRRPRLAALLVRRRRRLAERYARGVTP